MGEAHSDDLTQHAVSVVQERECAVVMSAVALVSFIEGSEAPYSVSGRKIRGDEHDCARCIRFFMM